MMPYLFAHALEARDKGIPLMRAMLLEFPDDPTCNYLDRQYMLGESLLVAPVFTDDSIVTYYLPVGRWTNFFSGETTIGPGWVREAHDFMSLPLMVRPNSVIALGNHDDRPDYDYADSVTLQVYQFEDGSHASVEIPSLTGEIQTTFDVKREGRTIIVERDGKSKEWQLLLVSILAIASVEGATVKKTPQGVIITPIPDTDHLRIMLS
jgi:alpha-D-xyloside xylohydrolase